MRRPLPASQVLPSRPPLHACVTRAGARLPGKAWNLSGAGRRRGRPACRAAERSAPGLAPGLAPSRHVQGSHPPEEAAQSGGGETETAERKEVPPGVLSRDRRRAASAAGVRLVGVHWVVRRLRRRFGRCGRRTVGAFPDVHVGTGSPGLRLGAAPSAALPASPGRSGPRELGRRQRLEGVGREVLPKARPAREALAASCGECGSLLSWQAHGCQRVGRSSRSPTAWPPVRPCDGICGTLVPRARLADVPRPRRSPVGHLEALNLGITRWLL